MHPRDGRTGPYSGPARRWEPTTYLTYRPTLCTFYLLGGNVGIYKPKQSNFINRPDHRPREYSVGPICSSIMDSLRVVNRLGSAECSPVWKIKDN